VSRFHVLRSWTRCRQYRGRRVPFSCFALPDSLSALPSASDSVFMFCAPGLIFGGTEGVRSRLYVLRAWTRFLQYRGRRVPFSCFALPDSFSAVPRASVPVFMFCAPGLVFSFNEYAVSRFLVLRSQTHFWRHRGRRLSFSFFALSDSFSAVPRASDPVFIFCAPGLDCHDTEVVGSRFHVCALGLIFGGIEGVGFRFQVLRSRTRCRRCRVRRGPFSCFALPDSFSAVPRASGSVFMFCTRRTRFRLYRGRRVPFSCFALPDSFLTVPRASVPVSCFAIP
jgi:hypothetical protein